MTYGLKSTANGVEAILSATTRAEFFKDALAAALEASYEGTPAPGTNEGQVVPLQAVGDDDLEIAQGLLADCLQAIRESGGTLHPPRWLAFDAGRVTANLPSTLPKSPARRFAAPRVTAIVGDAAPHTARIVFEVEGSH